MGNKILVIDIGNSSTSVGLYRGGKVSHIQRFPAAMKSRRAITAALAKLPGIDTLSGVALSSVVPAVNTAWATSVSNQINAPLHWVTHRSKLGVQLTYSHPASIGPDRLANVCGGVGRYGAPLIVADFGTALTFDVVTRKEGYVGGVIAPGWPLMLDYLSEKTALLPKLEKRGSSHWIGKSTEEAMRLGADWGYQGMAQEILSRLRQGLDARRVNLVATGGDAKKTVRGLRPAMKVDMDLTLYGIGRVFELNMEIS